VSVIDDDGVCLSGKNEDDSVDDAGFPYNSCGVNEIKQTAKDHMLNRVALKTGAIRMMFAKECRLINLVSLAPAYTRCWVWVNLVLRLRREKEPPAHFE